MRIFNKFVQSVKEPSNKNDIWFDGSVFRLYKQGSWTPITLTQEAMDRLIEYINGLNIYVMVDALPEQGEKGKIYILCSVIDDEYVEISEYVYDNKWKLVNNFNIIEISLDSPFEKGEAESSAVLKGGSNIAGLMGYKFDKYYYDGDAGTISLYASNPDIEVNEIVKLNSLEPPTNEFDIAYPIGVNISVVTDGHHNRVVGTVKSKNFNILTISTSLSDLIFGPDEKGTEYEEMKYSFFSLEHPKIGNRQLTRGATALGVNNKSLGSGTTVLGTNNKAIISNATALGVNTSSMGWASTSEGIDTLAYGMGSHAEGVSTYNIFNDVNTLNLKEGDIESLWLSRGKDFSATYGYGSHNEGLDNITTGMASHAEGMNNHAKGYHAHVEGKGNVAYKYAHAEGQLNIAEGATSHAEGYKTHAIGNRSHAEGYYTVTNNDAEHASGKYNKSNNDTIFSVGIGTSEEDRSNAIEAKISGDVHMQNGTLYTKNIQSEYSITSESSLHAPIGYLDKIYTSQITSNEANINITKPVILKSACEFLDTVTLGKDDGTDNTNLKVNGSITSKYKITTDSALEVRTTLKTGGNVTVGGSLTTKAKIVSGSGLEVPGRSDLKGNTYIGDSNKDILGIKSKTYIEGIGGYDGTNLDTAKSVQEVINELVNKLNEITTND